MCPNENPRKSSRTLKRPVFRLVGRRRIPSEIGTYRFEDLRFCEDLIGRDAGIRTRGKTALFLGNSGMGARMCPIPECQLHWASGQLAMQVPAPIAGARRPVWPDRPRSGTPEPAGEILADTCATACSTPKTWAAGDFFGGTGGRRRPRTRGVCQGKRPRQLSGPDSKSAISASQRSIHSRAVADQDGSPPRLSSR
jgi:hypothetical protein